MLELARPAGGDGGVRRWEGEGYRITLLLLVALRIHFLPLFVSFFVGESIECTRIKGMQGFFSSEMAEGTIILSTDFSDI